MTVERVRIGDVLRLERRRVEIDATGLYRLIGVYSFGKGIFHRPEVLGAELGDYRFFAIEPEDLVLSNIQAWEGAIGHATEQDRGTIGTNRFLTYVPLDDRIDTSWARWFLLSEQGMELIRRAAPGTAVRNRTLAIKRFEAVEIPLPPIDEQRWIAERLDRLVGRLLQLDEARTRAGSLAHAFAEASVREAAEGQPPVPLADLLMLDRRRAQVEPDQTYVPLGISAGGGGFLRKPPRLGAELGSAVYAVPPGSLVYSRLFAWRGSFEIAGPDEHGCVVSNEFPTFRVDADRVDVRYLRHWLLSADGLHEVDLRSKGSTPGSRNRLREDRFLEIGLPMPPLDEQRRVAELLQYVTRLQQERARSGSVVAAMVPAALNEEFARFR